VGIEPSGKAFNEMILNPDNKPHNSLINSGGLMICSLICKDLEESARF
jgi:glutaminase